MAGSGCISDDRAIVTRELTVASVSVSSASRLEGAAKAKKMARREMIKAETRVHVLDQTGSGVVAREMAEGRAVEDDWRVAVTRERLGTGHEGRRRDTYRERGFGGGHQSG